MVRRVLKHRSAWPQRRESEGFGGMHKREKQGSVGEDKG